jgi:hypothetical protein
VSAPISNLLRLAAFSPTRNLELSIMFVTHQVGSFFGFQFLGCLLTTVFQNVMICTTSETPHLVTFLIWLAASLGINLIGAK